MENFTKLHHSLLMTLSCIFSSCSMLIGGGDTHTKHEDYSFTIDSKVWMSTEKDQSDYAYVNPDTGNHIIVNSICKKYDKVPLGELHQNLLSGISKIKIDNEKTFKLQDRNARKIAGKGEMDGVDFHFNIITLKKNRCTFDLLLIGNQDFNLQEEKSFEKMLNTLKVP